MLAATQLAGNILQKPSKVIKYPAAQSPHLAGKGAIQLGSLN